MSYRLFVLGISLGIAITATTTLPAQLERQQQWGNGVRQQLMTFAGGMNHLEICVAQPDLIDVLHSIFRTGPQAPV